MVSSLKAQWNQIKGEAKTQWSQLTDNDWLYVEGEKDKLIGKIQEYYNLTKEEATNEVEQFIAHHMPEKDDDIGI